MPKRLDRCVRKVRKTGKSESSAHAICNTALKNKSRPRGKKK